MHLSKQRVIAARFQESVGQSRLAKWIVSDRNIGALQAMVQETMMQQGMGFHGEVDDIPTEQWLNAMNQAWIRQCNNVYVQEHDNLERALTQVNQDIVDYLNQHVVVQMALIQRYNRQYGQKPVLFPTQTDSRYGQALPEELAMGTSSRGKRSDGTNTVRSFSAREKALPSYDEHEAAMYGNLRADGESWKKLYSSRR